VLLIVLLLSLSVVPSLYGCLNWSVFVGCSFVVSCSVGCWYYCLVGGRLVGGCLIAICFVRGCCYYFAPTGAGTAKIKLVQHSRK
jgi:hypothetical protein